MHFRNFDPTRGALVDPTRVHPRVILPVTSILGLIELKIALDPPTLKTLP